MIATQDLIDALPWPVCCLDARGTHLLANPAYQALCGQPMSAIVGQTLRQVWPGELGLRLEFDRSDILQQGVGRRTEELWALTDADRWFDVQWSPVSLPQGVGLLLAAHDIDRQIRAIEAAREARETLELAVRERTAALEAANQELESFAYSVSHDLRAPMRAIEGFADLLLDDQANAEDRSEWLKLIRDASSQSQTMMSRLLELSRVQQVPLQLDPVRFQALLVDTLNDLRLSWGKRVDSDLQIIVPADLTLPMDQALMRLALVNLLGNALKFSATVDTPRIELEAMPTGDHGVLITIRDNGVGFDPGQASRLFGAFQRLHTQTSFPGTGVGLSIVRRIVHRHGGKVWADGTPGRGAVFRLYLPFRAPATPV